MIDINIKKHKILDFYYLIIIGLYVISMFIPGIRIGVIASVLISLFIFKYFRLNSYYFKNLIDILVFAYILYNLISFIWFLFSGVPVSVFIREYSNSILPIFFYYFAKTVNKQNNNFYHYTLKAIAICFVLGFILFIKQPYFYRYFLSNIDAVGTNILSTSQFYRSLIGVTATGSLGVIGTLISLSEIIESKGRKGKITLIICVIAVLLTFRRSALFVLLISLIGFHYLSYFKYNLLRKRYLLIEILIILLIALLISNDNEYKDLFFELYNRLLMLSDAVGERSGNWLKGLKYGNLIIGSGLGVFGHKVVQYSNRYIPDGNYIRMLAEIGIIGALIFISIVVGSILKGLKNLKENYLEIGIIIILSLQAIGSDIFSFQLIAPIFWFSIGRCQIKIIE